ncbi:unnamed protein product [Closterium sp. NIES-65]|nr:unnamed protein product [Closterium sp. NIES-65]
MEGGAHGDGGAHEAGREEGRGGEQGEQEERMEIDVVEAVVRGATGNIDVIVQNDSSSTGVHARGGGARKSTGLGAAAAGGGGGGDGSGSGRAGGRGGAGVATAGAAAGAAGGAGAGGAGAGGAGDMDVCVGELAVVNEPFELQFNSRICSPAAAPDCTAAAPATAAATATAAAGTAASGSAACGGGGGGSGSGSGGAGSHCASQSRAGSKSGARSGGGSAGGAGEPEYGKGTFPWCVMDQWYWEWGLYGWDDSSQGGARAGAAAAGSGGGGASGGSILGGKKGIGIGTGGRRGAGGGTKGGASGGGSKGGANGEAKSKGVGDVACGIGEEMDIDGVAGAEGSAVTEAAEDATCLLCDACDACYHLRCLNPPAEEPPAGDEWLCEACAEEQWERGNAVVFEDEELWARRHMSGPEGRGQWLLRGEWLAAQGHIRVGPMFQAVVGEWQGAEEKAVAEKMERDGRGVDDEGLERPVFGQERAMSEEEKQAELEAMRQRLAESKWPMGWQPVRNLPVSAEERWEQCEGILYYEGDVRADGKTARRDVECSKWRRVPSGFEVEDKFECSCALTFDPHHADCMVPQELPKRDLERRLKMISELKLQKQQQGAEMGEWKERMGELRAFRAQHGHCHVAPRSPLGVWLQKQRMLLRRNRLSPVQREELQQLNVTINLEDARWEENFAALVEFKLDYGHLNVSNAPHANTPPPPTAASAAAASAAAAAAAAAAGDGASAGAGAGGGGGGGGTAGGAAAAGAVAAAAAAAAGISGGGVSSSGGGSSGGQQQGGGRLRRAQDLARLSQWVKAQKAMAQQPFKGKKALQRICRLLEIGFVFSEGDSSS